MLPKTSRRWCRFGFRVRRLRAYSILGLALLVLGCHSHEHTFNVVCRSRLTHLQLTGAVVRLDGTTLGTLEPDPYLDFWPLNQSAQLCDQRWSVLRRRISELSLDPRREHVLEIVSSNGRKLSLSFAVAHKDEPRFINFGIEQDGTLACNIYHQDGSMTTFPGGATLR